MLSKDYLERGLVGMARASDAHWVEGHHDFAMGFLPPPGA